MKIANAFYCNDVTNPFEGSLKKIKAYERFILVFFIDLNVIEIEEDID